MIREQRLRRSTDVEIPTSGAGTSGSYRSLAVELLGLLVEWSALLDGCETLDLQFLAGLLDGCNPTRLLAQQGALLADDPARLVLNKITFGHSGSSLAELACKEVTPGEPEGNGLLLHGLHGFHCCHGFHCLHCLGHF